MKKQGGKLKWVIIIKIETYWNVNLFKSNGYSTGRQIKIETYWNVN